MAITAHRIRGEANGLAEKTASPDRAVEAYLAEALDTTLDNLAVGSHHRRRRRPHSARQCRRATHVLPLARGDTRQRGASATAAVVVARANMMLPVDVGTVARIYGLTPAETRVLQHLVAGASLTEAATALGVSETTAKTHRNHIFLKTGVLGAQIFLP